MWIALISNWKTVLGVVATAALAYLLHTVDVDRLENGQREALASQAQTMVKQCDAEKQITKDVSNDYEKKLDSVSVELARAKRLRPAACVPVSTPVTADGRDEAAGAAKPAGAHGVDAYSLLDFAGDAEGYRLQLTACQDFINKTWALNEPEGVAK